MSNCGHFFHRTESLSPGHLGLILDFSDATAQLRGPGTGEALAGRLCEWMRRGSAALTSPEGRLASHVGRLLGGLENNLEDLAGHRDEDIEEEFGRLCEEWKAGQNEMSSHVDVMHPAYQMIIGMGPRAVPLILGELRRELDHWFWALRAITRVDPVPEEDRGNLKKMAERWMAWGTAQGLL